MAAKNTQVTNGITKTSTSVGTRGESATARKLSGNHHGNKVKSNRRPKNQG